jgi:histidinol-phosphatase
VRQIPYFATQLALMYKGEIILGVSNAPALKELICAEKDQGAYLNDQQIHVSEVNSIKDAYLAHGNVKYFSQTEKLDQLVKLANSVRNVRGIGEFWGYHLVASGKIEAMIEANTKIWDIAAVTIITKEAGGQVSDISGNQITLTSNSIVASNSLLHEPFLKLLN